MPMRWGVKDKRQQRIEFVIRASSGKETMSGLCGEFQISRPTGYLWLKRFRDGAKSLAAVVEESRRPKHSPRRTGAAIERRVVQLRQEQGWGAKAIRHVLERDDGIRLGRMTVHRILDRHGLIQDEDRHPAATRRFERKQPNELWQMDFKGQFPMGERQCFPLTILDDHSRYLIRLQALEGTRRQGVERTLVDAFTHYGVPEAMLMDHGTPWWDAINGHGLTQLSVFLIKQGIELFYSGVRHPQTQGKVEKFHDTLRRAVEHRDQWPRDLEGWQAQLSEIREVYNNRRPHEALKMDVPVTRYHRSSRGYEETPKEWDYPRGSVVHRLNNQGQFYWDRKYRFVSRALANEQVCIRLLEQKLLIRYRHMWIREIDLVTGQGVPLVASAAEPAEIAAGLERR
jgi:transposase InsO family protein